VNKLQVLDIAVKFGLNVPNYLVTNSKIKMLEFYNKNSKKVITKDIKNPFRLNAKKYTLTTYTEIITEQRLQTIPATFYPSFFQVLIKKEYEVRVFYLDKEIYSMAIFSQNDKKTKVDFRHYNINTPNRCVPMNLPIELKIKIQKIMCNLKINCGSIDLIKSTDGLFYFLEINPFGQFGMISHPCNYQLEKKIAQKLSKNEKN
jgi:ATP-GRASP peptide maturase of grasp-with-spasm system